MISLDTPTDEQLARAPYTHRGRAAYAIDGGHDHELQQKIVALAQGHRSREDAGPREATLQVPRGRNVLTAGHDTSDRTAGEFFIIPPGQHTIDGPQDSEILLTVLTARQPVSSRTGASNEHRFSHVR